MFYPDIRNPLIVQVRTLDNEHGRKREASTRFHVPSWESAFPVFHLLIFYVKRANVHTVLAVIVARAPVLRHLCKETPRPNQGRQRRKGTDTVVLTAGARDGPSAGTFSSPCSIHLRISGNAARFASSPIRTRSALCSKSSYLYVVTSGSMTRSAHWREEAQFICCAIEKHWPMTSKIWRGPSAVPQLVFKFTAITRSAPISRTGCVGSEWASMPSTSNRPLTVTGRNTPG